MRGIDQSNQKANSAISRLRHTNYPMLLSPDDIVAIKNRKMCWVCKGEFDDGVGNGGEEEGDRP